MSEKYESNLTLDELAEYLAKRIVLVTRHSRTMPNPFIPLMKDVLKSEERRDDK